MVHPLPSAAQCCSRADGIVAERLVIGPLRERRFDLLPGAPLSGGCGASAHRMAVLDGCLYVEQSAAERSLAAAARH